jgi:RHS repeat-associated protein
MLSGPIPGVVAWTYDNDFRVASQSVNGANIVNVTYDRDSLLTQVGALSLTRDPTNGLLTGTKLNTVTDSLTYNAHAEPLDYRAKVGAADVYRTQFTRDALGRITQKIETIQGVTDTYVYSYDVSGRLIGVVKNGMTSSAYTYDVNSNRTSYTGPLGTVTLAQVTVDSQDRMTKYGVNTYTYNAHGDLTSKVNGAGTTNYTYDEFGNLTRVVLPGGTVIDYVIDAMNRRIGKKVNGTLVRRWLWSGALRVIAELDGSGILLSRFVYATRINVPDYIVQGAIIYRLVTDHLGSPRLLINIGTGAIVGAMNHDEYGRVTLDTMSALIPFGYAGGLYDSDTDFARFGVRDYDAETGRWTLKDPALFSGGSANIYTYVANNPISYVDPSGLQAEMTLVDPTAGNAKQQKNNRAIVDTANKYQSPDGTYTVFLHGVPGVGFDKDGKKLTAEDLARKISRDPEFDGRKYKTVRLAACQAGKDYAQEVFKFLARFGVTKVEYSDEKVFPNSATGKLQRSYKDDREIEFDWVPRN